MSTGIIVFVVLLCAVLVGVLVQLRFAAADRRTLIANIASHEGVIAHLAGYEAEVRRARLETERVQRAMEQERERFLGRPTVDERVIALRAKAEVQTRQYDRDGDS